MSEFIVYERIVYLDQARSLDRQSMGFNNLRVADASSSAALLTLKIGQDDSAWIELELGTRLRNFPNSRGDVWLSNTAQAGEWIKLHYWAAPLSGPPEVIRERSVIEGGIALLPGAEIETIGHRTLSPGRCFIGQEEEVGLAGSFAYSLLYNPTGSGVDLILKSLRISAKGSAGVFRVARWDAAAGFVSTSTPRNKDFGSSVASVAELRRHDGSGTIFASDKLIPDPSVPADQEREVIHSDPIVISPGSAVIVFNLATGAIVDATYEWEEKAEA